MVEDKKSSNTKKMETIVNLIKNTWQIEKEYEALEEKREELNKKITELPELELDEISLKINLHPDFGELDSSDITDEDDMYGIEAGCQFLTAREIKEKILPFVLEHFPINTLKLNIKK